MLAHVDEILISFIHLLLPLVGLRLILDYTRITLFKD